MRRSFLLAGAVALALAIAPTASAKPAAHEVVLSPEGNHLWAYDAVTGARQVVNRAVNGDDPGSPAPAGVRQYDINGQVCVAPDRRHILTGEDTVYHAPGSTDSGSSHDPRIAGWGYFRIDGTTVGQLSVAEVGKLAPEAGRGPGYAGDPDNYGCGFLDAQRIVTTAIGDTLPGEPATGQLFLWFGSFTDGFGTETDADGVAFNVGTVAHCSLDDSLATPGGIAVDANGDVYVATNRPDDAGHPGGVWRYRGRFPSSPAECTPEFLAANVSKVQVIPAPAISGAPALPVEPHAATPSAVAISPEGTLYVSSVFTGTVAEFTKGGQWVRDIYPLSPVAPVTGPTGDTPYGIAFTADHALWIADLGVVGDDAGAGQGSVIRQPFDAFGNPVPLAATRVNEGLEFPDGLGVWRPRS